MRDKIFIAWNGTNEVATKIKKALELRKYKCYIGGNSDNNSRFVSIGETVIQQMRNCNQAIVIFQNRKDGKESNNLFFELGYVMSSYGQQKVHCVKKQSEVIVLPSDFDNSFVQSINCETDECFIEGIIQYFIDRQKMSIVDNKMDLINNRHRIKDMIQSYNSDMGSRCSDYELAQYMLIYMQAAHMLGDERSVNAEIQQFRNKNLYSFSEELAIAVNITLSLFELSLNIKCTDHGTFYIDRKTFTNCRDKYMNYLSQIKYDPIGTFDEWATVFVNEHLTYCYSLYGENPDLSEKSAAGYHQKVIEYGQKAIEALEALKNVALIMENNDYRGIVSLFYAYIYRNQYLSYERLGNKPESIKSLKLTLKERANLKTTFELGTIDSHLSENFEMEYYLVLCECIKNKDYMDMEDEDIEGYKSEIDDYINKVSSQDDRNKYISRIKYLMNDKQIQKTL